MPAYGRMLAYATAKAPMQSLGNVFLSGHWHTASTCAPTPSCALNAPEPRTATTSDTPCPSTLTALALCMFPSVWRSFEDTGTPADGGALPWDGVQRTHFLPSHLTPLPFLFTFVWRSFEDTGMPLVAEPYLGMASDAAFRAELVLATLMESQLAIAVPHPGATAAQQPMPLPGGGDLAGGSAGVWGAGGTHPAAAAAAACHTTPAGGGGGGARADWEDAEPLTTGWGGGGGGGGGGVRRFGGFDEEERRRPDETAGFEADDLDDRFQQLAAAGDAGEGPVTVGTGGAGDADADPEALPTG
eukprot:366136-Chlamydomonas_euryale.AAC.7